MKFRDLVPAELRAEWAAAGYYPGRDLFALFEDQAQARPDQIAVIDDAGETSYAALVVAARRTANALAAAGIGLGDVVGVQVPNSWEACAVDLAVAAVGAVCMPYPVLFRERETTMLLGRSEAVAVVVAREFAGHDYAKMLESLRGDLPALRHVFVLGDAAPGTRSLDGALSGHAGGDTWAPRDLDPDGPVRVLVTSGTEAAPKMVLYSHNAVGGGIGNIVAGLGPRDGWRNLSLVPLSSGFGAIGTFATLARLGGTLVVTAAFEPARALGLIEQHRPTHLLGVPTMLQMMLAHPALDDTETSSLDVVATYGAAVARPTIDEIQRRFGCTFISGYGCSDGASSQTGFDDPPEKIATTVGRPNPAVTSIRIVDDEIWARGPLSPLCYFNSPDLDERYRAEGGWVRTGDLGVIDDDGYVRIVGRSKDIIIRGGYNISPTEIEEHVLAHPAVLQASCVGMPDERLGERICAFLVLREGAVAPTVDELGAFLRGRGLAKNKLPERVEVTTEMPLNPVGKILKRVLRERVVSLLGPGVREHRTGAADAAKLPGVVAVIDVEGDRVLAVEGTVPEDSEEVISHFAGTWGNLLDALLPVLGDAMGEDWTPPRWWACSGGDRVAVARDGRVALVLASEAVPFVTAVASDGVVDGVAVW